ncbi:MAG: hypothetical protein ACI9BD_001599 [Candidatus Marinamargulisbacteria bacterium]|jgi:hypothetical protein
MILKKKLAMIETRESIDLRNQVDLDMPVSMSLEACFFTRVGESKPQISAAVLGVTSPRFMGKALYVEFATNTPIKRSQSFGNFRDVPQLFESSGIRLVNRKPFDQAEAAGEALLVTVENLMDPSVTNTLIIKYIATLCQVQGGIQ